MTDVAEKPKVIGKECRFAFHIPEVDNYPDIHLVKELLHFDDGTTKPNLRIIKNFKRSFGVTRLPYRNHEQKKEYEDLAKVQMYECTQSRLRFEVAKALDMAYSPKQLNQLAESPYLYGSDISSTAIIKHGYMKQYPDFNTPYRIGFYDIETDVVNGTKDPILVGYVVDNIVYLFADSNFYKGYNDPEKQIRLAVDKYISNLVKELNLEIRIIFCDGTIDLIKKSIEELHKTSPDLVAIWNIGFDIPKLIETLEKYNVDPADVFSDPKIPPRLRSCKYKKGSTKKITASGQVKPKNPSEQWHSLLHPASFKFIDAMSTFRFLRLGGKEEPRYDLDTILQKYAKMEKLKFEEANKYHELDWHVFMQTNYKVEYAVYCMVDCIGMMVLENKTKDLSISAPNLVELTDFMKLDSQTKRFADKFHYYLLERGKIIATVPPKKKEEAANDEDDEFVDYIGDALDDDDIAAIDCSVDDPDEVVTTSDKEDVLSLKAWINKASCMTSWSLC